MCHDVGTPFKGPAVDGRGKGVVNNEWHAVAVGNACEFLQVEHGATRVGDGFAEKGLGVGPEGGLNLLFRGILRYEGALYSELLQGDAEEVVGAAVDFVGRYEVVAGLADVEQGVEVGGLPATGEHASHTALQGSNLRRHRVVGGVLQACVEIAGLLRVKAGYLLYMSQYTGVFGISVEGG